MDPGAANVIVQGFLKGGFDVFDALLSLSFIFDTADVTEAGEDDIAKALGEFPVLMQSPILGGGGIAMMFSMEDASKFISLTNTDKATVKDKLDESDLKTWLEIADSTLGGGISNLTEKFGEDVELAKVEGPVLGAGAASDLNALMDGSAILAQYHFSAAPHFDGKAVLLFGSALESRVPASLVAAVFGEAGSADAPGEPLVSKDEMNEILSGFTPSEEGAAAGPSQPKDVPENLDVILDIELIATARLGRVEMPISEVLNLGPGSIIEVGHFVDEPVELLVNDKLIARGDVVVVDEKFGLRITEVVSRVDRIESLR